ncbi:hypothetical protein OBBRIDRAFT_891835 [Obba rivulosa]|uniref:Uncharacterized protein n=1 Tax=Obba rivulosa TaxID=1052685 RepID=A0A8E2DF28_9APHY|nr:hypothetical protein OBBRIDRAFT_891835 [Obba rivulosa]
MLTDTSDGLDLRRKDLWAVAVTCPVRRSTPWCDQSSAIVALGHSLSYLRRSIRRGQLIRSVALWSIPLPLLSGGQNHLSAMLCPRFHILHYTVTPSTYANALRSNKKECQASSCLARECTVRGNGACWMLSASSKIPCTPRPQPELVRVERRFRK